MKFNEQSVITFYSNRNLYIFFNGIEWFNQQANKYFNVGSYEKKQGLFDENFYRVCWELDNDIE